MGIKDSLYTEKGKITAGVLAAVLLTTAVMVPVSIFTDRSIRENGGSNLIQTYGYDAAATSTGARQDWWMGIEGTDASKDGMDAKLLADPNYHPVTTPEAMIDGVTSSNGVSYLSNTDVQKHNTELKALNISTDKGSTWITPTDDEYINAPLNINMKVPVGVANALRNHLANAGNNTPLSISDLGEEYASFLTDNNYEAQFAMSFAVFNYVAFAQTAYDSLNANNLSAVNTVGLNDQEMKEWFNATFGDEWHISSLGSTYPMVVDGTGTDEAALNFILDALNNNDVFGTGIQVMQSLNNGGSFRAWETTPVDVVVPGVTNNPDEYDSTNNGVVNAFIGTQSRGIETNKMANGSLTPSIIDGTDEGEISYWGYDEKIYDDIYSATNEDDIHYKIGDLTKDGMPLSTTMAADKIVFFTTKDLEIVDPFDGTTKKIEGVTKEGFRSMFQFGTSWETLAQFGDLELV